ncbi:MAG: bifunctional UDP-N-acetylglucosamine diphosphorylase/glucosamine-1-phosphate N-acetyltransferase GlmU [bacterium]
MKKAVVILAAGLGTRLKSKKPKVLHTLLGKPMIAHVLDSVAKLRPDKIVVVVHPHHEDVHKVVKHYHARLAIQNRMSGTADAVKTALEHLKKFRGVILVLNGDSPLLSPVTLRQLLSKHQRTRSEISVLSFTAAEPYSYGRIIRDSSGKALRIVEENDLSDAEKNIREVNSGVYAFNDNVGKLVGRIQLNRKKKEYYITDLLEIARLTNHACSVFDIGNEAECHGVNTMFDLIKAETIMQKHIIERFMNAGVRFYDPGSVVVHPDTKIGPDCVIYPNVCFEGKTVIGEGALIFQGVRVIDSKIGRRVVILDHSLLEISEIGDDSVVGPCAHLRPHTKLGKSVKIGNFVEIKNASLSDRTKASHLSYIGDATIGADVNIGAGTITCNYDGFRKHHTRIRNGVFVGSDTQLVAPVEIGKNAFIAAGSTITSNVTPFALAMSRTRQREIAGWVKKQKRKRK